VRLVTTTARTGAARTGACLRIWLAAGAALTLAPAAAGAQQPPPSPAEAPIGDPRIGDFRLEPRQRIVTQPRPAPQPQATPTPPAPAADRPAEASADPRPRAESPRPAAATPRAPVPTPAPAGQAPRQAAPAITTAEDRPAVPQPGATGLPMTGATPAPAEMPAPGPAAAAPPPDGSDEPGGLALWMILLGGLAFGLVGYMAYTRRRGLQRGALAPAEPAITATPQPQAPRVPRADPVPRPWLDIELIPERTTADPEESAVEFELTIRNKGGSTAANVQLQAKLFCSTPEQDKEIAAFHRKKPGEHRTLAIPDIPAGQELRLKGRVDIKRDQIKVFRIEGRLLFVPLVAVNAFYGWANGRTGQTSKSFLVGREQADSAEKMAPFRLDLGPRVYRTVGQRPYTVERRV